MKELILAVIVTRKQVSALAEDFRASLAVWQAEHAGLIADLTEARVALEGAEKGLREAAIALYERTGEKKPAPGVEVKMGTKLIYEEAEALGWAFDHHLALLLDKRAFEKIAKASALAFVVVEQVPFATIATELKEME